MRRVDRLGVATRHGRGIPPITRGVKLTHFFRPPEENPSLCIYRAIFQLGEQLLPGVRNHYASRLALAWAAMGPMVNFCLPARQSSFRPKPCFRREGRPTTAMAGSYRFHTVPSNAQTLSTSGSLRGCAAARRPEGDRYRLGHTHGRRRRAHGRAGSRLPVFKTDALNHSLSKRSRWCVASKCVCVESVAHEARAMH